MTEQFAIWSHHHDMWFAPNGQGYRSDVSDAGLFSPESLAQWMTRGCSCCRVPEVAVKLPEPILTISPRLAQARLDAAIDHATRQRMELGSTNRYYERSLH